MGGIEFQYKVNNTASLCFVETAAQKITILEWMEPKHMRQEITQEKTCISGTCLPATEGWNIRMGIAGIALLATTEKVYISGIFQRQIARTSK